MRKDNLAGSPWKCLLVLLVLLGACKKTELPPPIEENPVFSVNGTIGNQTLDFVAGVEDYYLFTSFKKDENDVYSFIGRFEKTMDCERNCKESLEFEIRDITMNLGSNVLPDRSLAVGEYTIAEVDSIFQLDTIVEGYDVILQNKAFSSVGTTFEWSLINGVKVDTFVPEPLFLSSDDLGQEISLTVQENTGLGFCMSTKKRILQLGGNPNPDCDLTFNSQSDTITNTLCANMTGIGPFEFKWEWLNDSMKVANCLVDFEVPDSLPILLTGTDAQGCVQTKEINTRKTPTTKMEFCSADFDYDIQARTRIVSTPIRDSLSLSKVIIRYTDTEGFTYSSEKIDQNSESGFEILESSEYLVNENGEATRLLKVRFSGILSNDGNSSLSINCEKGVVAVAYPK